MLKIATIPGCLEEKELQIHAFRQNSQEVERGDLFFALVGKKNDGHQYLKMVAERGAIGAVVGKEYQGEDFGLFLFRSENVLQSMQDLAREHLIKNSVPIVGITGSVGKTTTKEFLATLLSRKYRVGKSPGSMNSQISLPLNLLNRKGDEEILILEMGMSYRGEIERLVSIAPPEMALITKLSMAHVANFEEGLKGVAKAKKEIFSHPKTSMAVINYQLLEYGKPEKEFVCFSVQHPEADFFLTEEKGKTTIWERGKKAICFTVPLEENHFKEDFLAAASACRMLGLSWQEIEEKISSLQPPKMRFEKLEAEGVLYINDAYNSSPDAVIAALESLPEPKKGGRRIAILGEMADQGLYSHKSHNDIGKKALLHIDYLFCYGKETEPMYEAFSEEKSAEFFLDKKALLKRCQEMIKEKDVVLIKGKRLQQLEELFFWLTEGDR